MLKAFNTIDHSILTNEANSLISSYLTNRKHFVMIYSSVSFSHNSVPHSSILNSLLFLIGISANVKFIMYADDTTPYSNLELFSCISKVHKIDEELPKINKRFN